MFRPRSIVGLFAALVVVSGVLFPTSIRLQAAPPQAPAATPAPAADASPDADHGAVFSKYCVTCHNQKLKTAGLALDTMDVADVAAGAPVWEKVVKKLRAGMMPPQGMPRPDATTYNEISTWLETELDR